MQKGNDYREGIEGDGLNVMKIKVIKYNLISVEAL